MRAWGPGGKAPWQGSGGSATSGAWGSVPRARRSRASETSQNVNRGQANADGAPDSRAPKHNGVRRMQTELPIPAPQNTTVSGECRRDYRFPRPKTQRCQANADGTPDSRAPKHNGVRRMQTGLPHSPEEKSLAIYALRYPFSSEFSSDAP